MSLDLYTEIEKLSDLMQRTDHINKLKQAVGSNRPHYKPQYNPPKGGHMFDPIANKLKMNSREVELLLVALLESDEADTVKMFRDMLIMAKLSCPEAVTRYADELATAQESYANQQARYDATIQKQEAAKAELTIAMQNPAFIDLKGIWSHAMDQLKAILDYVEYDLDRLNAKDRLFYMNLEQQSKHVRHRLDSETGKNLIEVDWTIVRNEFKAEHIRSLIRSWIKKTQEQENGTFYQGDE